MLHPVGLWTALHFIPPQRVFSEWKQSDERSLDLTRKVLDIADLGSGFRNNFSDSICDYFSTCYPLNFAATPGAFCSWFVVHLRNCARLLRWKEIITHLIINKWYYELAIKQNCKSRISIDPERYHLNMAKHRTETTKSLKALTV